MNRIVIGRYHWSVSLLVECRITRLRVILRELENLYHFWWPCWLGKAYQKVFFVASLLYWQHTTPESRNCSSYPQGILTPTCFR